MKTKEAFFASAAFALGALSLYEINHNCADILNPIIGTCTDPGYEPKIEIHPYESRLSLGIFGPLHCLLSQFLFHVKESYPAGLLTFSGIVLVYLPIFVVMGVEAGRGGAKGLIRYPTLICFLSFALGVSVIIPTMWCPAYFFGRGGWTQPVSPKRAWVAIPSCFANIVLVLATFLLDANTYVGQLFASLLTSPVLVFPNLVLWNVGPPADDANKTALHKGVRATVTAHFVTGCLGFILWWFLVGLAVKTYGGDTELLWSDLWTNADPSIVFMTIDVGVVWLAGILLVAFHSHWYVLETLLLTLLLGPGASLSYVLSQMELERLNADSTIAYKIKKV